MLKRIFLSAALTALPAPPAIAQDGGNFTTERNSQCNTGAEFFFVPHNDRILSSSCTRSNFPMHQYSCDSFLEKRVTIKREINYLETEIPRAIQDDLHVGIWSVDFPPEEAQEILIRLRKDADNAERAFRTVINAPGNAYRCMGMS